MSSWRKANQHWGPTTLKFPQDSRIWSDYWWVEAGSECIGMEFSHHWGTVSSPMHPYVTNITARYNRSLSTVLEMTWERCRMGGRRWERLEVSLRRPTPPSSNSLVSFGDLLPKIALGKSSMKLAWIESPRQYLTHSKAIFFSLHRFCKTCVSVSKSELPISTKDPRQGNQNTGCTT